MDLATNDSSALSSSSSNTNIPVDPLMEQMRSILRLGPRASDPSQRRERRFSDTDRPQSELPTTRPESIAIRSRDGSRWLPAPDEQSHRVGMGNALATLISEFGPMHPLVQHDCSAAICAIANVFETTELLELILSFLESRDVFSLRRTSRLWDSTIHQSPQLRLHFFTYGQWSRPGSQFLLLPLSLPGPHNRARRRATLGSVDLDYVYSRSSSTNSSGPQT